MPGNDTHFSGEGHLIEAVVLGDPNKTVVPVVCDAQGRLIIDLSGSIIEIGKVDQGNQGTIPQSWFVELTDGLNVIGTTTHPVNITGTVNENPSLDANVTSVTVGTSSTTLIGPNLFRKGLIFQSKDSPIYYILGTTPATTSVYSYYVLKLNSLELENFYGTVSAVVASGTASVQVTEKI